MGDVSTQGTRVVVGASSSSFASNGADVEGYAHNFTPKASVDPLPLFVRDQPCCCALVVLVEMSATTEVASNVRRGLLGSWRKLVVESLSTGIGMSSAGETMPPTPKLIQKDRYQVSHLVLVKNVFVENEAITIVSMAYPRGVRLDNVTPIRRPVLRVVRPGCNDAEEICKHVRTFGRPGLARTDLPLQVS